MQLREILLIDESPLARQLRHVVAVIDSLHRFPSIPPIPLVVTKNHREGGAYRYRMRPSVPLAIDVSIHADAPPITLLHETGHLLDHLALNPIKRGFASEYDPLFDPLRVYWSRCRTIRKIVSAARVTADSRRRSFMRYQLGVPEIWARTYLQWATAKSGDLLLDVSLRQAIRQSANVYLDQDEMKAIMPLVDRLFSETGLG